MSVRRGAGVVGGVVEGVVEAIVPGGAGIVRDRDGVVLARGGLPGERVRIEVARVQKRVRHGVVVDVLSPSPDRVAPDCALHPRCGGCDLLALAPAAALRAREGIVRDALLRIARFDRDVVERALAPIRSAPAGAGGPRSEAARRRVRVLVDDDGAPTLSAAASHERVPLVDAAGAGRSAPGRSCLALDPLLDTALGRVPGARLAGGTALRLAVDDRGRVSAALDGASRESAAEACARLVDAGVCAGAVFLDDHDDGDGESEVARAGDPSLRGEVTAGAFPCTSDAGVFTQATRFGGRAILDEVLAGCGDVAGAAVLELFAGAGHLSVPLAHAGADVEAVEGAARAVAYLERNVAACANAGRVTTRRAYIDAGLALGNEHPRVVVADPPRTGIPGFDGLLARLDCARLVLVSCDPATGARDLAAAVKRGFTLERLVPIDAFPRTSHVEWVATLTRAR